VAVAEKPRHETYNSGGAAVSLGEMAAMVRAFLPDADIRFKEPSGGRAISGNFMIDNRRLVEEFGLQYAPLRQRVKEVINDIRRAEGLPLVG
jgi:nucleoside-diphosphate-sugar epimerase